MADFTQIPVSKEMQEILTAGWSKPAELKIEKGELILRTPDLRKQRDEELLKEEAQHSTASFAALSHRARMKEGPGPEQEVGAYMLHALFAAVARETDDA